MNNKVDKTSDFSVMAIFLVDLQISEKTKLVLTRKELVAMIFFLLFALIPWEEILRMMVDGVNRIAQLGPNQSLNTIKNKRIHAPPTQRNTSTSTFL